MKRKFPLALTFSIVIAAGSGMWSLPAAHAGKSPTEGKVNQADQRQSAMPINDRQFHQALLQIAKQYQSYGKVDDMLRWAPTRCYAPPAQARLSSSADSGTHGKKVYFLFAKNRDDYYNNKPSAVGQAVVKESWLPNSEDLTNGAVIGTKPHTEKGDLFIMFKLDPAAAETDAGWVYGTASADGKTITSAGRVQSCMSCHMMTKNDRLFGLKK